MNGHWTWWRSFRCRLSQQRKRDFSIRSNYFLLFLRPFFVFFSSFHSHSVLRLCMGEKNVCNALSCFTKLQISNRRNVQFTICMHCNFLFAFFFCCLAVSLLQNHFPFIAFIHAFHSSKRIRFCCRVLCAGSFFLFSFASCSLICRFNVI